MQPAATADAATRSRTDAATFSFADMLDSSSSSSSPPSSPPLVFRGLSLRDLEAAEKEDDAEDELENWTWLAKETRFGGAGLASAAIVVVVAVASNASPPPNPPPPPSACATHATFLGEH